MLLEYPFQNASLSQGHAEVKKLKVKQGLL